MKKIAILFMFLIILSGCSLLEKEKGSTTEEKTTYPSTISVEVETEKSDEPTVIYVEKEREEPNIWSIETCDKNKINLISIVKLENAVGRVVTYTCVFPKETICSDVLKAKRIEVLDSYYYERKNCKIAY